MALSQERVREFVRIARESFGLSLREEEAREQAERLIAFFSALAEMQQAEAQREGARSTAPEDSIH